MARVFITGSADGLGRATAQTLLGDGHEVIVHARIDAAAGSCFRLCARGYWSNATAYTVTTPVSGMAVGLPESRSSARWVDRCKRRRSG